MVAEQIPQLVQGVRGSQAQPDSPSAQLALIGASQNFMQVHSLLRPSHPVIKSKSASFKLMMFVLFISPVRKW